MPSEIYADLIIFLGDTALFLLKHSI